MLPEQPAAWNAGNLSFSLGARYLHGTTAPGTATGLWTAYAETVWSVNGIIPLGAGGGWHWPAGGGNGGPGAHLFFCVPWVFETTGYLLVFYRPGFAWLGENRLAIHEVGLYFKFSNLTAGR